MFISIEKKKFNHTLENQADSSSLMLISIVLN